MSVAAHRLGNTLAGVALVAAGVLLAVAGLRSEPPSFGQSGEGYVNTDRPGIDNHNSPASESATSTKTRDTCP